MCGFCMVFCLQTLAYLLPALTLALQRAEAAYRRRQAAIAAGKSSGGRVNIKEEDQWTVQVCRYLSFGIRLIW